MNKHNDSGSLPGRPAFVLGALVLVGGWLVILKDVSALL